MKYLVCLLCFCAFVALGEKSNDGDKPITDYPLPIGTIKAVMMTSLTARQNMTIVTGDTEACTVKKVVEWLIYGCKVSGAQVFVSGNGTNDSLYIDFNELSVIYKAQKDGSVKREYVYRGVWTSISHQVPLKSAVYMQLNIYDKNPDKISGYIELEEFGIKASLTGYPEVQE